MTDRDPGPLRPELAVLYAAERAAPAGHDAARRAIRDRLERSMHQGLSTPVELDRPASLRRTASRRIKLAATLAAIAAAVALLVGIALRRGTPARSAVATSTRSSAAHGSPLPPVPAPATSTPPGPIPGKAAARPGKRAPAEEPSQPELLEDASRALAAKDASRALDLVEHDARAHPSGDLAEERDALRIEALLALGHLDDARARATEFQRAYPSSVHQRLIERALRPIEENP